MSVAAHLGFSPAAYDDRIRGLLPYYDELIAETARALTSARRPVRHIVDLGMGTGTLSRACLAAVPGSQVAGIELDASMSAVARARLGRLASRARIVSGNFLEVPLPSCDAIVATYALHHIRERRAKGAFYRRCARALRHGGVLISGDCFPPDSARLWARDVDEWVTHLARTFRTRARARREFDSWSDEDTYVPLGEEISMLTRCGLRVDVPWRRTPFAVIAAVKPR